LLLLLLLLLPQRWRERLMTESVTTTDHDEIRRWAESRDGTPANAVRVTESDDDLGVLRIRFRDASDLDTIGGDEFFAKFEEARLEFLYQDETADGGTSRFHKFVRRD
jgi:hypothetical protein